ncbi:unnamed protein product [Polarella glacialis]|uniref:Uncharacterized protein n=1 Tax=Polarella glacialis TaxID=89957 RepID=A0A813G4J1_POLGL|nr:unnamed protein product [Polarella glacialis]CAE8717394.1 unnamed protein product [Polarella glacialis]
MAVSGTLSDARPLLGGQAADPASAGAGSWKKLLLVLGVYCGVGLLLCGTYVWGGLSLTHNYSTAVGLWGRIAAPGNEWLLHTYYASILLAILGFFPALAFMVQVAPDLPEKSLYTVCGLLLAFYITEMFWIPMCVAYIAKPSKLLFGVIRVQLAISGILAVCWAVAVCSLPAARTASAGKVLKSVGCAGTVYFAFHCAVLDALVWPPMFE